MVLINASDKSPCILHNNLDILFYMLVASRIGFHCKALCKWTKHDIEKEVDMKHRFFLYLDLVWSH